MRLPFFCLCFILFAALAAVGQETVFAEKNCALTPPQGWQPIPQMRQQQGVLAAFMSRDSLRLVLLVADDHSKPVTRVSDQFIASFDRGVDAASKGTKLSGRMIKKAGVDAYERLGSATTKGKATSIFMQVIPVKDCIYSLQGIRIDGGDAGQDPDIRESLASFRFLQPPELPPAPGFMSVPGGDPAFRIGYVAGKVAFYVIVIAAVVALVGWSRRRSSRASKRPPPLP